MAGVKGLAICLHEACHSLMLVLLNGGEQIAIARQIFPECHSLMLVLLNGGECGGVVR